MTNLPGGQVAVVRMWVGLARHALLEHRDDLDRINVFPVPDADTGSNLVLTLAQAEQYVGQETITTLPAALRALADGASLGARGNSGIILSEFLRGLCAIDEDDSFASAAVAHALSRAAAAARRSVAVPVEGTILTAADAAADSAAQSAMAGTGAQELLRNAAWAAVDAANTGPAGLASGGFVVENADGDTERLPDAGALGLALILEAWAEALEGAATPQRPVELDAVLPLDATRSPAAGDGPRREERPVSEAVTKMCVMAGTRSEHGTLTLLAQDSVPSSVGAGGFEIMFVLCASAGGVDEAALRAELEEFGGSVVVGVRVDEDGFQRWPIHLHTADPCVVLAEVGRRVAGDARGALCDVRVRSLDAPTDPRWPDVVVVTASPGLLAPYAGAATVALLAHSAGSVVVSPDGSDIRRALSGRQAGAMILLAGLPASDAPAPLWSMTGPGVEVLPVPDDAAAIAGVVAGATAEAGQDRLTAVRTALTQVRTICLDSRNPAGLPGLVAEAAVVTAIVDRDVDEAVLNQVAAGVAMQAPEAEWVTLHSGLPGHRIALGVESGGSHDR